MTNEQISLASYENGDIRLSIRRICHEGKEQYHLDKIEHNGSNGWITIAKGNDGREFMTSMGECNATRMEILQDDDKGFELRLSHEAEGWNAVELLSVQSGSNEIKIQHEYTFHQDTEGYVRSGLLIDGSSGFRYTYPLQVYDVPTEKVGNIRCDCSWAVPLPFHVLSTQNRVVIYGIDRTLSGGTLDASKSQDSLMIGLYYPDSVSKNDQNIRTSFNEANEEPEITFIKDKDIITLAGTLCVKNLKNGQIPLLEAEKMAASILLTKNPEQKNFEDTADRIADFYRNCELWNPNALGPNSGWFRNMWIRVSGKTPQKDTHYDLGWGEGYGAAAISALVRNWKRTGKTDLLIFANEMTRNIECFRKNGDKDELFYERFNEDKPLWGSVNYGYTDFMGAKKIWSHSLGHVGYLLLKLYADVPEYPDPEVRELWFSTALSIASVMGSRQKADGDIQDGFDELNNESNRKAHRIPARASICALWSLLGSITGDKSWQQKSLRLAHAVSPEIHRYEFYNQMLDGHIDGNGDSDRIELVDGENACYAFEGLAELYCATHDETILELCKKTAAYLISWIYFYDVPHGYGGITRGGTVCRMPDYPLLYLGAGAVALMPLIRLSEETGDSFYKKISQEMLACITMYQWNCPSKPWHGGIVHAYDQRQGLHWGPDREGQVDTGMTSGMCLVNLEMAIEKMLTSL